MLYILYLYILSFICITNCSESNQSLCRINNEITNIDLQIAINKWVDLRPTFKEEQKKIQKNYIAAYSIIKELREKCYESDHTKNTPHVPIKKLIEKTQSKIEDLYKLGNLSQIEIYEKENYIKRNCLSFLSYRTTYYYNHFRASLVVAENIWSKILTDVEELGLDPEKLANNI